jgi:hypothetical protein
MEHAKQEGRDAGPLRLSLSRHAIQISVRSSGASLAHVDRSSPGLRSEIGPTPHLKIISGAQIGNRPHLKHFAVVVCSCTQLLCLASGWHHHGAHAAIEAPLLHQWRGTRLLAPAATERSQAAVSMP